MAMTLEQFLTMLARELYRFRIAVFVAFCLISLAVVVVAALLPKTYSSFTVIHADEGNIIRPLMEGTAVATSIKDQARNARELLFSRRIIVEVLREAGLPVSDMSDLELERLIEQVQGRTQINAIGQSLIRIEFRDPSATTAFRITQKFAEHFVTESATSKRQESQDAYSFIDKQVREYHAKLSEAEQRLKEYRSDNIDGTTTDSFKRISELRQRVESSRLALTEANIQQEAIQKQLSGEADVSRGMMREGAYQARIAQLQMDLDTLRLSFHDSYPDIVQLKNQIAELNVAIEEERQAREQRIKEARARGDTYIDESIASSPLFQQLRSELAATRTNIATLKARIAETEQMLAEENERIRRINDAEATLAELTRDYEVNRDIYQDLLKRREKARVSMHLDIEERGLTMKIQEPARLSLQPSGLRFMHLAAIGIPLGLLVPIGFLGVLLQLDPRIRSADQVANHIGLPVLGEIARMSSSAERNEDAVVQRKMLWGLLAVFLAYAILSVLKIMQVL
jgi:polysaccharide chain length determinant protein (PEP-CTERM system associated)